MKNSPPIAPEAIKEARWRLRETQTEFGARLGINQATVSRWENGHLPNRGPAQRLLQHVLQDIERVHPLAGRRESVA